MTTLPELRVEELPGRRRWGVEWPHFARWQWKVLLLLTLINLLNYFDRLIVFPMFSFLKDEFLVSDFKLGLLGSVFILVHSLSVLPLGWWSDHGPKQKIMAGGVLFWSLATTFSGFAASFRSLLAARALVGVGEAAYAPAGTALMTSSFPPSFRARVQSIFNLGMLVGGVLGLAAGGVLSAWVGWRSAFFLVGLPGFVLAIMLNRLRIPIQPVRTKVIPVRSLLTLPPYLVLLPGGMFVVFASSAFASWGVEFATRYHDLGVAGASVSLGTIVLVGSVCGVFLGGYIADRAQERWPFGRALTIAVTLALGTPFLFGALVSNTTPGFLACIFFGTLLVTCYHGPATAVIHDLTPPHAHSFAFAFYLFFIHLFGDAVAPALIGRVSDVANLRRGMMMAVAANLIAAACFFLVTALIRRRAESNATRETV